MKSKLLLSLAGVLVLGTAHGQVIVSGGEVTGDSSVLTQGTEINSLSVVAFSFTYQESDPTTITLGNGVYFSPGSNANPVPFTETANGVTGVVGGTAGNTGLLSQTSFTDSNLNLLLTASVVGGGYTLDFSGLTPGGIYQLQIFTAVPGGTAGTETVFDGSKTASLGFGGSGSGAYSAIDTFKVASGHSTESVAIGSSTTGTAYFTAYQLREVPEPTTTTMLLMGGLIGAGWAYLRRHQAKDRR